MELDSESSYTTDMHFNSNSNLQMMQAETPINGMDPVGMVMDYKGVNKRGGMFKVCVLQLN